ncbi:MAG: hypothetical protein ACI8ZX_000990 [Planctomycetota bacterium]|jgi:hypothetical protein
MKYLFAIFSIALFASQTNAQTLILDSLALLPNEIVESSGLIYFDNKLITHTDSGGENALYEIDTNTAQVLRKVYITNSVNNDWEDITQDENYIYIADFGNNQGSRTDLKILKISKTEFQTYDSIQATFIKYSYEDQTDFTPTSKMTNFDAEAIISIEDSLYIFTKNWGNQETSVYPIPKDTGTFIVSKNEQFDVEGMITAADYNHATNTVFLIGYTPLGIPFAFSLKDFDQNIFFSGDTVRFQVQLKQSVQIEAICSTMDNKYYVSSEDFFTLNASLHTFKRESSTVQSIFTLKSKIRNIAIPNPIKNKVCIDTEFQKAILYNALSQYIKTVYKNCFEIAAQKDGIYFLKVFDNNGQTQTIQIVKQ